MGDYVKVRPKAYAPRGRAETGEGRFWRSFGAQHIEQQYLVGAVSCVDFCPTAPHHFAVTSSTRVVVYNGVTREVKRNFSRFSDIAYSGTFRADGKLLVAGGESGIVQIFDANSRLVLRKLTGHKGPVHAARFAADKVHVVSAGDDRTVRHWDMASQDAVAVLNGHHDYVRSLASNPAQQHVWATGSYDHSIKLWDLRSPDPVLTLQHGQPVEDVAFFSSGSMLVSAGSNYVCVWDILGGSGGRRLYTLSNHQKTVTSVCISPPILRGPANRALPPRLLTGALDCHVKVYDPDTFKVVHASVYAAPVLSLGISANASTIAVGMASGLLAVRHRRLPQRTQTNLFIASITPRIPGLEPKRRRARSAAKPLRASNFRYFLRGRTEKAAAEDFLVAQRRRLHLAAHDRLLRRFRYADALNASLETGRPEVIVAVMEELAARGGLTAAMSNREQSGLVALLSFVARHVTEPRHAPLLLPVAARLLDLYATDLGMWPAVDQQVSILRRRLSAELRTQQSLLALQGMLQPLIRTSTLALMPAQA